MAIDVISGNSNCERLKIKGLSPAFNVRCTYTRRSVR